MNCKNDDFLAKSVQMFDVARAFIYTKKPFRIVLFYTEKADFFNFLNLMLTNKKFPFIFLSKARQAVFSV